MAPDLPLGDSRQSAAGLLLSDCFLLKMVAAELPTDVLASILLKVARPWHQHYLTGSGLASLAQASCVSRSWRAAADAAAEQVMAPVTLSLHNRLLLSSQETQVTSVELCNWQGHREPGQGLPAASLRCPRLQKWARYWRQLHIGDDPFTRCAHLHDFLRGSCTRLEDLCVAVDRNSDRDDTLSHAYLEAAAAALLGLQKLTFSGFIPGSGLPAGLTSLSVTNAGFERHDTEALLLRLQAHQHLREVSLENYGFHLCLSATSLAGLQLPRLAKLELRVSGLTAMNHWDLSWLALPRSFDLTLIIADEWWDTSQEHWDDFASMLLGSSAMQPQDTLVLLVDSGSLSLTAQRLLQQLRLAEASFSVSPSDIVHVLPKASVLKLFWYVDSLDAPKQLSVSWSALSQDAGRVSLEVIDSYQEHSCELHVTGYTGPDSLPTSRPWRLSVEGPVAAIHGLPPAVVASRHSYVLLNQAAIDAGWT